MRPRKYSSNSLQDGLVHYEEQGGCCAICRKPIKLFEGDRGRRLNIDHCHKTGLIRGVLCPQCNSGLGMFADNPATLARAILYLTHLPQRVAGFEDGTRYVPIWPIYCGDKTEAQVPPHLVDREKKEFSDAMRAAANRRNCEDCNATA